MYVYVCENEYEMSASVYLCLFISLFSQFKCERRKKINIEKYLKKNWPNMAHSNQDEWTWLPLQQLLFLLELTCTESFII